MVIEEVGLTKSATARHVAMVGWTRGGGWPKHHIGFNMEEEQTTYHNGHADALHETGNQQKAADDTPASCPALNTARYYNAEGDQRAQFEDDVKGYEEAHGPPHAAEVFVFGARLLVGEGGAGTRDAGAAAVEPHGNSALVVLGGLAACS